MHFSSSLPALLFHIPILSRILADSRINATVEYLLGKANVVIETHLTAPTPTKPRPFIHDPTTAPKRLHTFGSPSPHRPLFLAAHSIPSTSSPFTFLDAFIFGCIVVGVYVALAIYCQSNRRTELEKARITAHADLEAIRKTFRVTEKAHRKETRMIQEKFAHVASFVEETERCAEEAEGKLKAIATKIGEMEKKVQDEEKRVVKDARMQQRLDEINKKVDESAKAFQKDRDKLKRSLEQFSFDLRKEMMEKVEAANSRAEEAKNELEGYMKSSRTAPGAGDAREHTLRAESEERIMRWTTEMMGKNEKRYRREMDKLRADHRNDLDQLRAENVKRETQRAQELSRMRSKDTAGQEAWFLSIKEAIMKDEDVRVEERRKEMDVRLLEKEEERAALSKMRSDICRSANSILGIKSKSVVRVMEQLKWRREAQEQLIALSKDINECRWDLKQVRKARPEAVDVDGRGHGIALIPTPAVSRAPTSPEVSLQGLPTPAASQSPPPHVKATFPLKQAVTVTDRQTVGTNVGPISTTQVKQEETSFDFQRAVFYAPLEAKVSDRIGTSNVAASENVSSLFAFEQSISLSKGYSGDDLLTITPPRWLDSSIFESLSFDDAFYRGRILPSNSFRGSRTALRNNDDLREISLSHSLPTEGPSISFDGRHHADDSLMLSNSALFSGDDLRTISPPPWLQRSTDSSDAVLANISQSLSTNKAGIKIKCQSPTPSPSKFGMRALGNSDRSTSFHLPCTSSPPAPRTMKTTSSFDDHSFSCAHEGFLPTSSSWLGCNLTKTELKRTINRNADKQAGEGDNHIPSPRVVPETSLPAVRSPSYPSMSAYLPALVSTSSILSEAASPSPSPSKTTETNEREMLVWQKSKVRRRRSYGDEPRASAVGDQDPHHHTLPVIVSDIFNPS